MILHVFALFARRQKEVRVRAVEAVEAEVKVRVVEEVRVRAVEAVEAEVKVRVVEVEVVKVHGTNTHGASRWC